MVSVKEYQRMKQGRGRPYPVEMKDTYEASLSSITIKEFLQTILRDDTWVRTLSKNQKIAWLRGIWDAEGTIAKHHRNGKVVSWSNKNETWAQLYIDILTEVVGVHVNVHFSKSDETWRVFFTNSDDISTFHRVVKPTISRKRLRFEKEVSRW